MDYMVLCGHRINLFLDIDFNLRIKIADKDEIREGKIGMVEQMMELLNKV